jgi:hypothetical protein
MKHSLFLYAGKAPRIVATRVVALYDPTSGRIHHTHTVHVHEGGRDVHESETIEQARRHAKKLGHDIGPLKVKLSTYAEHGHLPHRIDAATGEFVPLVPSQERRR